MKNKALLYFAAVIIYILLNPHLTFSQDIIGKALVAINGDALQENYFLMKIAKKKHLLFMYDANSKGQDGFSNGEIFNHNISYLSFFADPHIPIEGFHTYNNCIVLKLTNEKTYTICPDVSTYLAVYKVIVEIVENNKILEDSVKLYRRMYDFLAKHHRPFDLLLSERTEPIAAIFKEEIKSQKDSLENQNRISFQGTGKPALSFEIIQKLSIPDRRSEYKEWIYLARTVIKGNTSDVIVKTATISKSEYLSGQYQESVFKLLQEARKTAFVGNFPNILKVVDFTAWHGKLQQDKALLNLLLVLDDGGTSLDQFYTKRNQGTSLSLQQDKVIIKQLLNAVVDLHNNQFYHFDIKPHNFYLKRQENRKQPFRIRISGLSNMRSPKFYQANNHSQKGLFYFPKLKIAGTSGYIQQCIFVNQKRLLEEPPKTVEQMEKKDSFALGMTLIYTFFKKHLDPDWHSPTSKASSCEVINTFLHEFYPYNVDTPFLIKTGLNSLTKLVYQMIAPDFETRITVKKADQLWGKILNEETQKAKKY